MQLRLIIVIVFCSFSFKTHAQSTASQQVIKFEIEAPQLKSKKNIWVYLPKSYATAKKAYDVIYMHDAQNLFDAKTSYVGEWKVDEYLDSIAADESIIIGIEHGNEKRMEELTPYPNDKYGGGKGDIYLDFIINTLKPYIDSHYKTLPEPQHTTIMGSSLGGLLSFYAVIKHPETFGNAGVFSPSFWFSDEIYNLVEQTQIPKTSRLYFLIGSEESEDMVPDLQKMIALLKSKAVNSSQMESKIIEGGKHNETLWSENFPEAYQWLMKLQ